MISSCIMSPAYSIMDFKWTLWLTYLNTVSLWLTYLSLPLSLSPSLSLCLYNLPAWAFACSHVVRLVKQSLQFVSQRMCSVSNAPCFSFRSPYFSRSVVRVSLQLVWSWAIASRSAVQSPVGSLVTNNRTQKGIYVGLLKLKVVKRWYWRDNLKSLFAHYLVSKFITFIVLCGGWV